MNYVLVCNRARGPGPGCCWAESLAEQVVAFKVSSDVFRRTTDKHALLRQLSRIPEVSAAGRHELFPAVTLMPKASDGAAPCRGCLGVMGKRRVALRAVKAFHTGAWFSIEACMVYLLYAGFRRKTDRRAALAAAVVGGETLVFVGNGFRCPLTPLAQRLGDTHGSVTDIYLPRWFAHNLPAIHVPLIVLAVALHRRNFRENRFKRGGYPTVSTHQPRTR